MLLSLQCFSQMKSIENFASGHNWFPLASSMDRKNFSAADQHRCHWRVCWDRLLLFTLARERQMVRRPSYTSWLYGKYIIKALFVSISLAIDIQRRMRWLANTDKAQDSDAQTEIFKVIRENTTKALTSSSRGWRLTICISNKSWKRERERKDWQIDRSWLVLSD